MEFGGLAWTGQPRPTSPKSAETASNAPTPAASHDGSRNKRTIRLLTAGCIDTDLHPQVEVTPASQANLSSRSHTTRIMQCGSCSLKTRCQPSGKSRYQVGFAGVGVKALQRVGVDGHVVEFLLPIVPLDVGPLGRP